MGTPHPIPECTHVFGHEFEPRYDRAPLGELKFSDFGVEKMSEATFVELAEMKVQKTYLFDICRLCGYKVMK